MIVNSWKVALICCFVYSALWTVTMIDQPRKPFTRGDAVGTAAVAALLIWLVIKA